MTTVTTTPAVESTGLAKGFLWLEITGKCPFTCLHCYNSSGPDGSHGTMTTADWLKVLDDAAAFGVTMVQYIGGEPSTRRDLEELVQAALSRGLAVEVFSTLARVRQSLWEVFALPGVSLATSWYSDDPAEHQRITGADSHAAIAANISRAVNRGIPLRVGLVDILDGQRVTEAIRTLTELGVAPNRIGVDRFRQFGRGRVPKVSELCGKCGDGRAAIGPNGEVWPCIMARWIEAGNVRTTPLAELLEAAVVPEFAAQCAPESCEPNCVPSLKCRPMEGPCDPTLGVACEPAACGPSCSPKWDCGPLCGPGYCGPK